MYRALVGRAPSTFPRTPARATTSEAARLEVQDQFFQQVGQAFVAANYNLKFVIRDILLSPTIERRTRRARFRPSERSSSRSIGTGRLSTPELLSRKIEAVTGLRWKRGWDSRDWLTSDYRILYGGIDSDTVTQRLTSPNGIMASVMWRMANEVACGSTAWDISRPAAERKLFPFVEVSTVPAGAGADAVKQNIQYLHSRVLGEDLALDDPELLRTYQLFLDTWNEGQAKVVTKKSPTAWSGGAAVVGTRSLARRLPEGERLEKDENYVVRSWMAVLTYLLADYQFLYE